MATTKKMSELPEPPEPTEPREVVDPPAELPGPPPSRPAEDDLTATRRHVLAELRRATDPDRDGGTDVVYAGQLVDVLDKLEGKSV